MSPTRRILTVVGLVVGAVVVAVLMVRLRPEPPRRPPEPDAPAVTVQAVEKGDGPLYVFGAGTVRPRAEIDLASEVGGKITWVSPNLQSGGRVRAGEVLVRVDAADYRNRVEQARAEVAAQQVAVLQAEEEAQLAREEYDGFRARESGRARTVGDPSPLALRQPQLDAAKAALARAGAALAEAELALARTEVRSPFDGRVRSEVADPGSFVQPGQGLARIYASDAVEVVVPLSDDDALQIPGLWTLEAGDDDRSVPASVTTNFGGRPFTWDGYVDRAETDLDEQSRTLDVVVRVPDPFRPGSGPGAASAPPLLVGQFVDVQIQGRAGVEYFLLPRRALRPGDEVWAIDAEDRVRIVPVEVLQETEQRVYALGDFTDGQRVIVAGLDLATDGMRVRPRSPAGSPDSSAAETTMAAPSGAAGAPSDVPREDQP